MECAHHVLRYKYHATHARQEMLGGDLFRTCKSSNFRSQPTPCAPCSICIAYIYIRVCVSLLRSHWPHIFLLVGVNLLHKVVSRSNCGLLFYWRNGQEWSWSTHELLKLVYNDYRNSSFSVRLFGEDKKIMHSTPTFHCGI